MLKAVLANNDTALPPSLKVSVNPVDVTLPKSSNETTVSAISALPLTLRASVSVVRTVRVRLAAVEFG